MHVLREIEIMFANNEAQMEKAFDDYDTCSSMSEGNFYSSAVIKKILCKCLMRAKEAQTDVKLRQISTDAAWKSNLPSQTH